MGVNTNLVPNLPIARSPSKDDDDAFVQTEKEIEDINLPLEDTDESNPNGAVVRCTESGYAVYNDNAHQVVFSPDGRMTVLDRDTGGGENLKMNFTMKDGVLTCHNPRYTPGGTEPEFISKVVPKEGMELVMSDGTTMFISPNGDGTFEVAVVNIDSTAAASEAEKNAGTIAKFHNVGSEQEFSAGSNAEGAVTGGKAFLEQWEAGRQRGDAFGDKGGSDVKLWVTSMYQDHSTAAHNWDRRENGDGSKNIDYGQEPGGFSRRSDGEWDINKGAGETERWLFYDMTGDKIPEGPDAEKLKDTIAKSEELLRQGDAGVPLFENPNNPAHEGKALFGDGTVAGSDGTEESEDSELAQADGNRPSARASSSSSISFGQFLAADWWSEDYQRPWTDQAA
jgi:hypothetical protein